MNLNITKQAIEALSLIPGEYEWWEALPRKTRIYLLKAANLDSRLHQKDWEDIPHSGQVKIIRSGLSINKSIAALFETLISIDFRLS